MSNVQTPETRPASEESVTALACGKFSRAKEGTLLHASVPARANAMTLRRNVFFIAATYFHRNTGASSPNVPDS